MISLVTGLLFSIVITRNLSTSEFGVWGNINDLLTYFTTLSSIVPFWSKRFLARGYTEAAKTGLAANILISIIMTAIYLVSLPIFILMLGVSHVYAFLYAIISIQILEQHMTVALASIIHIKKPQAIGFGLLIFEVCKITIAIILVLNLGLRLLVAIYAIMMAHAARIAFYLILTRKELKGRIKWTYIKEWIKASPLNIYNIHSTSPTIHLWRRVS